MTDLHWLSITEVSDLIQRRELSPVEMTDACLARIEAAEPRVNAFITVLSDAARADANRAADEIARGDYRGPLHGIPVALKDIFDVRGVKTTAASKILAGNVATADSDAAERLGLAGAGVIGKLNMHEFAYGATGVDSDFGPARNPWDPGRVTGGSSSGSGASVSRGASRPCFPSWPGSWPGPSKRGSRPGSSPTGKKRRAFPISNPSPTPGWPTCMSRFIPTKTPFRPPCRAIPGPWPKSGGPWRTRARCSGRAAAL